MTMNYTVMRLVVCLALALCVLPVDGTSGRAKTPELPTTIILLRHAEKEAEPKDDPSLNAAGRERAELLLRMLSPVHVDAILTSPFARTRQTVAPLAESKNVAPEVVSPKDFAGIAKKILTQYRGKTVVVVGHSNTVPGIIEALGGPKMDEINETEFDNLFIVTVPKDRHASVVHMKFGS